MFKRLIASLVCLTFIFSNIQFVHAQSVGGFDINQLPVPGTMVDLSPAYVPLMITGLSLHPENPLLMDFILSTGNSGLNSEQVKAQSDRLIKYFLACLTIPEDDQWVNLSPYEKERIIPKDLGQTILGRDMMAQDYLLKQLTASLIYPEKNLGKNFWDKVYEKARQMYGTSAIPVNTFNKVWILPDTAKVYEHKNTVFVVKSHLRVMLDEDYLALSKHADVNSSADTVQTDKSKINSVGSQIVRQIVLPAVEEEVNTGTNFAQLRQIYNSMILAVWFKKNLKQALLNQVYTDKSKVNGVNVDDPAIKEKIYRQYLAAYKKGVFNYIKEETDPNSDEVIPRKYFSGGLTPVKDVAMATSQEARDAAMAVPEGNTNYIEAGFTRNASANLPIDRAQTVNLTDLLNKSDGLITRMQTANQSGNFSDLNEALEAARVALPGSSPSNSPYLFAFSSPETTEAVDATKLSVEEIQQRVAPYLNFTLSAEDAQNLKDQKPFSLEDVSINNTPEGRLANEARSNQVALIEEAALKAGLLGTRYYVTNIKRFSPNSPLMYMDYLSGLAREFNGHAVFLLSIEESDKVLLGDMAGEGTAIAAVRKVLGEDFLKNANIDIITDGGLKTRAGGSTALNGYNGLFPTAYGMTYYRRAMQLLAKVRMQERDYGQGKVFWTASDGDYQIGNMQYGQNAESDLPNDDSWSLVIHGVTVKIVPDDQQPQLLSEIQRGAPIIADIRKAEQEEQDALKVKNTEAAAAAKQRAAQFYETLSDTYSTIKEALILINQKKLSDLGENFSDPVSGRLVYFKEKPTPAEILQMLLQNNTNSIIPNAFLIVFNQGAFIKQQDALERVDENTGKALREFGGSYFDFLVGSQFNPSGAFNNLKAAEQDQIHTFQEALPASTMFAANQGEIGAFTDRGKSEFLVSAYYEEIDASKARGETGLIKRGVVNIGKNVTLKLAPGATVILDNVVIESENDQPIEVDLSDYTFFQNTILRLNSDVHFGDHTVIVNSRIEGKIELQPDSHNVVVEGVIFNPGAVQDFTQDGQWENPQSLQLYSEETMVSILKLDGTRYVNRAVTNANYKGDPLVKILGGADKLDEAKVLHPRLGLNLPVENSEWITHPNWQGQGTQNVDITAAKPYIDYVKMSKGIQDIQAEVIDISRRNPEANLPNVRPVPDMAALAKPPGGIDINAAHLNMQTEGDGVNITFDPAMIEQFKRGDFSGVRIQILNIVPVNLMPLLGLG